mgnify:CR=1 FL=1
MDNVLHLLGIARKAGRLEVGEEPVGASARSRQAKLILIAADAAENSARRASHFAQGGRVVCLTCPYSKAELGAAVGRSACAMLALTDVGLASALVEKLAGRDPGRYTPAAEELAEQARRALQRQREQRAHEKKLQRSGRKPWAPPPAVGSHSRRQPERPPAGPPPHSRPKAERPAPPPGGGRSQKPAPAGPRGIVSIRWKKP